MGYIELKKRFSNVSRRWVGQWKWFSKRIAICDFLVCTIFRKSKRFKHIINGYYYRIAQDIIEKKYSNVINNWGNYNVIDEIKCIKNNSDIYIFWWQGLSNAPDIIKKCVESIIYNAGEHTVRIIDKNNWSDYCSVDERVVDKLKNGQISITLFSDVLRCNLLYENGGIWIDPTCYLERNFDNDIYKYSFYTIKHGDNYEFPICKGLWATFFLASGKHNPLLGFMKEFFSTYWKNEQTFIVYLSLDLILSIAYDNITYAKNMIDLVPENNKNRDDARNIIIKSKGKAVNFIDILNEVDSNTYIHKLTYKMNTNGLKI